MDAWVESIRPTDIKYRMDASLTFLYMGLTQVMYIGSNENKDKGARYIILSFSIPYISILHKYSVDICQLTIDYLSNFLVTC